MTDDWRFQVPEKCSDCGRLIWLRPERDGSETVMEATRGRGKRPHSCPGYFASRSEFPMVFQGGIPGGGRAA